MLALGLLLFVVLAYLLPRNYEVVDEGEDLLPYEAGFVKRVEFFHRVTVYVAAEQRTLSDIFNAYVLVSISSMALLITIFLRRRRVPLPPRRKFFFLALWLGTGFLAADELLALHETLGHNLRFLADLPGVTHPDDVIFALYGIPALAFLGMFRGIILSSRAASRFFAFAIVTFVLAAILDLGNVGIDEVVEPLTSLAVLAGFVALAVEQLTAIATAAR